MLIVGDGGSTKADWWFLKNGEPQCITTTGFNPLFHSVNSVLEGLGQSSELKGLATEITKVYFYGASCSDKSRNKILEVAFDTFFPNAINKVDHDLMGAAIATCKASTGIVCILGTGSNAAYFDGKGFPDRVPALGYILGDEGSGAYIGRKLLADFLYQLVPEELNHYLSKNLKLNKEIIFNHVYQKPYANKYLASFAKELSKFNHLDYTEELVTTCFDDFVKYHITCYSESKHNPINFVGSVAHHFKEYLEKSLEKVELKVNTVIAKPGKEIFNYYLSKES